MENSLSAFVKCARKRYHLTQMDAAEKSGVGIRFVRDLEQGKASLQMDKVNQLLHLFNAQLGVVELQESDV